jgi:hypothetical protein
MPQTYNDQPVRELQHIWVGSEQSSLWIVCRDRIFLAGGPWRRGPQGLAGRECLARFGGQREIRPATRALLAVNGM